MTAADETPTLPGRAVSGETPGVDGYGSDSYGEGFADVYDEWYADVTDVEATVAGVVGLAPGGRVLELGVGTGRVALPLAGAGCTVTGVDASAAMLDRLAAKPGGDTVTTVCGDMADRLPDGPFDVVLATFNTFFNLTTEAAQRACLALVVDRLASNGRLVVEAFVPDADPDAPRSGVEIRHLGLDRVVLSVSRRDPLGQTVDGQLVELVDGRSARLRPWSIRYLTPDQLDAMAADAGLRCADRWSDWHGSPFVADDDIHISLYERA